MSEMRAGFKRPMVHHPEAAAATSRVKTRSQVLMEELGLTEEESGRGLADTSSSSEEEERVESQCVSLCQLATSDDQRHQLSITLQETRRKLRSAQASLVESEQERDRRVKLMRKTHKTTMANKQHMIEDLQDIIEERDRMIRQLQGDTDSTGVNNKSSLSCDLHQLVDRISLLHSENSSLTNQYEETMDKLQHSQREKERLEDELVMYRETPLTPLHKSHMAHQFNKLQARLDQMEEDHDETASHLTRDLQQQVESLSGTVQSLTSERDELLIHNQQIKPLSSEVCRLERELSHQLVAMSRARTQLVESEGSNKQLALRVRHLEDQLVKERSALSSLQHSYTSSQQLVHQLQVAASSQDAKRSECSEEHYHHLVEECARLRQQLHTDHTHYATILSEVRGLRDSVSGTRSVMVTVSELMRETIAITAQEVCQGILATSQYNIQLIAQHREEVRKRRRLHNQLVELKGNIRVMCRVRPTITEDGPHPQVVVRCDPIDDGMINIYSKGAWKQFDVDQVFGSTSSQEQVFSHVEDLVVSCMDGYHVCIFAYGQTGSGKTHTMEGPTGNPGINQLALTKLFSLVEGRGSEWSYTMMVSVIEIYNETVRDLLSSSSSGSHQRLDIKQRPGGVYVPGLTEIQVTNMAEVQQLFDLGRKNRSTGATLMNIHSSRSHALLCVTVTGHCSSLGVTTHGRLNLIDLAGSERLTKSGSDGVRQQEACHINKSLSALGDVIHSLRSRAQHIPYRNSRLTYLLQDSLGGDSKTLMVVCVSPVNKNVSETVCSVNFAQRVKTVELGQASKRVAEDSAITRVRADTPTGSPSRSRSPLRTPRH